MSKLDKNYPGMLQKKFGDHPSISSVEEVVTGFSILSPRDP
jgi:hypothetical protein